MVVVVALGAAIENGIQDAEYHGAGEEAQCAQDREDMLEAPHIFRAQCERRQGEEISAGTVRHCFAAANFRIAPASIHNHWPVKGKGANDPRPREEHGNAPERADEPRPPQRPHAVQAHRGGDHEASNAAVGGRVRKARVRHAGQKFHFARNAIPKADDVGGVALAGYREKYASECDDRRTNRPIRVVVHRVDADHRGTCNRVGHTLRSHEGNDDVECLGRRQLALDGDEVSYESEAANERGACEEVPDIRD
mmetsp:Transcript_103974/g.293246  ORF Transcript_103974/g.293246 Transcript_103974/m.293246 type:complete len:252 (+) Transcript_103974:298-1053(+)